LQRSAVVVGDRRGAVTQAVRSSLDRLQKFDRQSFIGSESLQVSLAVGRAIGDS